MKERFRKTFHRATCFLAVFLCLFTLVPATNTEAAQKQFSIKVDYAFGNSAQTGYYSPFEVTVTNNGSDFEGTIILSTDGLNSDVIAYEQPLSLAAGATKTCHFIACLSTYNDYLNIKVSTNKGKVIFNEDIQVQMNNNSSVANVGILTDDYAALSYLSGQFFKASGTTMSMYRLDADSLPENPKGLDMIDAIIISNFPTDSLSSAQKSALLKWVSSGGLLIIGTGDSAGKTLSGFDGILNVPTSGLKNIKTTYGLSDIDFIYSYTYDYDYNYNGFSDNYNYLASYPGVRVAYSLIDFSKYVDESMAPSATYTNHPGEFPEISQQIYDENSDIIIQNCWEAYYIQSYSSFKMHSDIDYLMQCEAEFRYFAIDNLIPDLIAAYLSDNFSTEKDITPIDGQICEFSFGEPFIECDSEDGSSYPFASYSPSGDGYICVLGVDLTKSPFIDFSGNKDLVIHIIESLAGARIIERLQNYGWRSGNYFLSNLMDRMSAQKLTPALIYIVLLFAYVAVSLIIFFRLRKKGKSMLIWPIQAGFALAGSFIVFVLGFSTRVSGASVNSVRLITNIGGTFTESDYAAITMPKVKHYTVPFKSNYAVLDAGTESTHYYRSGAPLSKSDYTICYSEAADGITLKFNNITAMSSKYFSLENKEVISPDISFDCTYHSGRLSGTLVNNSDKILTDSFICVDFALFKVGNVAPGETIDLSTLKGQSILKTDLCDSTRIVMNDPDTLFSEYKVSPATILLGTGNKHFRDEYDKRALIEYLEESYLTYYPGFGNQYDYFSVMQNGKYMDGRCLYITDSNVDPSDPLGSLGFTADGFIEYSAATPLFVSFSENPKGVTKNEKDNMTEMIIISDKPTDSMNRLFSPDRYSTVYK